MSDWFYIPDKYLAGKSIPTVSDLIDDIIASQPFADSHEAYAPDGINAGVYKLTNPNNNRFYIGCSYRMEVRMHQHKISLESGTHISKLMQRDYNEKPFTPEFKFIMIDLKIALELERRMIYVLKPEYNSKITATPYWTYNQHHRYGEIKIHALKAKLA